MGQILSHAEIEAILAGLDFGAASTARGAPADSSVSVPEVAAYDFEHPIPLHPAQLDNLRLACATVTQALQTGLSGLFRLPTIVEFLGVEQSTFRDYLATAEQPACLAVYESTSPRGTWLLDISRSLAFTMIDCLLGGTPTVDPPTELMSRPFTELESRFIDKAVRTVLPQLTASIFEQISLQMTRIISDSSLLPESSSNEAVALISYEIICGQSRGLMQLCVPWMHVAHESRPVSLNPGQLHELMQAGARKVPVIATVRVTRLKLSARELAGLCPGDVLLTEASAEGEMSLDVGGHEIFRGTPGQIQQRRVLRLTTSVTGSLPPTVRKEGAGF